MTKRQRVILGLWTGLLLLALWWAMGKTSIRSDLSLFLPTGTSPVERLLQDELNSGPATRLLLLAIEGGELNERIAASHNLADSLQQSELFSRVENGSLSLYNIQQRPLFDYRYLLSSKVDRETFDVEGLKQSLQTRLRELQSVVPSPFKALLPADPTSEYQHLLQQWLPKSRPHLTQGVWTSEDGERALLLAETHASAFSIDVQQQAVELIERTFRDSIDDAGLQLIISGPGAFSIQSRALIQQETRNLSLLASAGVMLLLFLAYRSLRYVLIAIVPLASAMLAGILVTGLIFGELHGITLAFGVTLLGITIDYPLHLFSHLRPGESADKAVSRIWPTLRLGVATTCIGYLVLVTTDFTGLRQLGVFTLAGLITAALSSRWILPILILPGSQPAELRGVRYLAWMLRPSRPLSLTVLTLGLLIAGSLLFATTSIWQDDIGTLTPTSADIVAKDREIRRQLHAPEPHQLVIINGMDLEFTLQASEKLDGLLQSLVNQGAIGGYDLASRYLPSIRTQQLRRDNLPSAEKVEENLHRALEGLPFRQASFKPFIDDIRKSHELVPLTFNEVKSTPPGMRLKGLLRERDDAWLLLTPLNQVKDETAIIELLASQLPAAQFLNLRDETSGLVAGFRHQTMERLAIGIAVMLLVLGIGLSSATQAVRTLLPVLLAVSATAGVLYWSGISLTLFHLVSLMLVLGIGLDYSLFFGRDEQDIQEPLHTLHALFICALSTSIVFGILGSSDIPVLRAIGQTVALGVIISFITTLALSRRHTRA